MEEFAATTIQQRLRARMAEAEAEHAASFRTMQQLVATAVAACRGGPMPATRCVEQSPATQWKGAHLKEGGRRHAQGTMWKRKIVEVTT